MMAGCNQPSDLGDQEYPRRAIKIIVPFAAGGGTDTHARLIAQAIDRRSLLPQPIAIINVPGASGTIGSRRVLSTRPDGYTLLCLHEAILTAKYAGKVSYGPEAFEPIAGTGSAPLVICVYDDSPFRSLGDLMQSATDQPDQIIFSASIGAPSQFAGLMLENQSPGAAFRYTQTGGGAKRFAALKGGHVQVSAFSLAEYAQFQPDLRALAICSAERHPSVPDVPTASEQGYPVVSENTQFWWAPKGTDPKRIAVVAGAIEQAMKDPDVLARLESMHTDPLVLSGPSLVEDLAIRTGRLQSVVQPQKTPLPNFPLVIGTAICFCVIAIVVVQLRASHQLADDSGGAEAQDSSPAAAAWGLLGASMLCVTLYVAALHWQILEFRIATIAFLVLLGTCMMHGKTTDKLSMATRFGYYGFAIVFAVALHALFTQLLVLDLP